MHLIFKIITQKEIPFEIPLDKIREFPTYENYFYEGSELVVIYIFKPAYSCDVEKYKEYLCKYLKRKYNAYSVTAGELQNQLT